MERPGWTVAVFSWAGTSRTGCQRLVERVHYERRNRYRAAR